MIKKTNLELLQNRINNMISLIEKYDTEKTAQFLSTLKMMSRNIDKCIESEFDGISELDKYLKQDWRTVCKGDNSIEKWVFDLKDIREKIEINKIFDDNVLFIDRLLNTDCVFQKIVFNYDKLINKGKQFECFRSTWDESIEKLKKYNRYYESPIEGGEDDIWTFAKSLNIQGSDEKLQKWFYRNIPAFNYLKCVEIIQLENGSDILRSFLFQFPF